MRAVVQRVKSASVSVDGNVVGSVGRGYMVLIGVEDVDEPCDIDYMCEKLLNLRIFEDEDEKMNLSIQDVGGEMLVVSQFTLLGDARKGRRPSFIKAARPEKATPMYEELVEKLSRVVHVETGVFGAHMEVSLVNDGPVTMLLESRRLF